MIPLDHPLKLGDTVWIVLCDSSSDDRAARVYKGQVTAKTVLTRTYFDEGKEGEPKSSSSYGLQYIKNGETYADEVANCHCHLTKEEAQQVANKRNRTNIHLLEVRIEALKAAIK